jgi:4-amino-4-deoxy-L-arabinose transferase-like glycosyltransferase
MSPKFNTALRPTWVIITCVVLWLFVYIWGALVPILESDSAHNAIIGMRMYLTGNWVDMIYRGNDYLDKPHLAFWMSAIGNSILGVTTLAYKLPSLLIAIPGIYATYRLGKKLYSPRTGIWAAIILISTQAFILGQNDVRMDAILLSMSILATWMLYEFSVENKWIWLIGGSFFLAMAFSTKGMSGAAPPVIAVLSQALYSGNRQFLLSFRWIWGIPLFFLFSFPVLYSYYLQFDLHPEKVIRGMSDISGVAFILFYQNIERMDGANWGSAGSNDPFLFFHSLLWVLLPWSLMAYWAYFRRAATIWKERFQYQPGREILTFMTILVMFTIMSVSNFKLPHYLNILFPYFSILIAAELENMSSKRPINTLLIVQKSIAVLLVIVAIIINTWLFPVTHLMVIPTALLAIVILVKEWRSDLHPKEKIIGISAAASLFVNLLLNGNFYPRLQEYSAGYTLAGKVSELNIPPHQIYPYHWGNDSFTYYTQHFYQQFDPESTPSEDHFWLAGPSAIIHHTADSLNLQIINEHKAPDYRVTRLKGSFLNPATRLSVCDEISLLEVRKGK